MPRTTPVTWSDFTDEIRHGALSIIMSRNEISREYAVDLLNEAEAKLVRRGTVPKNVQALLVTTMRTLLIDHMRKAAFRREHFTVADRDDRIDYESPHPHRAPVRVTEETPADSVADEDHRRVLGEKVRGVLNGLPRLERRLLQAHYFEGKSYPEIAVELGLSRATASDLGRRVRQQMREAFMEGGMTADDLA